MPGARTSSLSAKETYYRRLLAYTRRIPKGSEPLKENPRGGNKRYDQFVTLQPSIRRISRRNPNPLRVLRVFSM